MLIRENFGETSQFATSYSSFGIILRVMMVLENVNKVRSKTR